MSKVIDFIDIAIGQSKVIEKAGKKYVLKKYLSEPGLVKWFIVKSISLPLQIYPYVVNPRERMKREIDFFKKKPGNVNTPKIIEVNWDELYILREYIEGEPLLPNISNEKIVLLAETLHNIHRDHYCLGDSKYTNFLFVKNNSVYVIDAEQSTRCTKKYLKTWDIIVLTTTIVYAYGFYKSVFNVDELLSKIKLLLKTYSSLDKDKTLLEIVNNVKLKTITQILLPIPYNIKLISIVREFEKE